MPAGRPHRQCLVVWPAKTLIPHVTRTLAVCMIVREVDVEDWRPVECPVDHGAHDVFVGDVFVNRAQLTLTPPWRAAAALRGGRAKSYRGVFVGSL